MQVGSLSAGQRYEFTAAATGPVDPSPLSIAGNDITFRVHNARVQYEISVPAQVAALNYSEALFWVGNTLCWRAAPTPPAISARRTPAKAVC